MYLTIYVTKNRICPLLGLYGKWPARSAFGKLAKAGVRLATRQITDEEREIIEGAIRFQGIRWPSLRGMLHDERDCIGDVWFRRLMDQLRENRGRIAECLREGRKKETAYQADLFNRRAKKKQAAVFSV